MCTDRECKCTILGDGDGTVVRCVRTDRECKCTILGDGDGTVVRCVQTGSVSVQY